MGAELGLHSCPPAWGLPLQAFLSSSQGPQSPLRSSRWRSFLTWPWLSLSVPSVHPPKSTTPSWRWLAPTLSLADPGHLPIASPTTLSRSWVPMEPAALLHRHVLPHLARCHFSQQHFQPFCSTVWGTELNGPKHPEDIFATLDLDPEVFGQGLCCVYP